MLCFLAWLTLLFLAGLFAQCLLEGRGAVRDPEKAAACPALGAALLGSMLVLGLVVFDRYAAWAAYALPGLLLAGCIARGFLRSKSRSPGPFETNAVTTRNGQRQAKSATPLFLLAAVLFTLLLLALTLKDGAPGDYLSIWAFKALVLTENDHLRIPSFLDWMYYHHHQDYPLLFPSLQASLYRMSGAILDRTAMLLYPLLLLSASLYLYFYLLKREGPLAAVVGGGFCLMTPGIAGYHPGIGSADMDVPLGIFLLLAVLSGLEWLRAGRGSDALRAGVFLAGLSLTKNEGLAAAALVILVFFPVALRRRGGRKFLGLALLLAPVLATGGCWFFFRKQFPAGAADYAALFFGGALIEHLGALPEVLGRYLLELLHFERWGFLWVLAAASAPFWIRKGGALAGLILLGMAILHIAAVTVSPLGVKLQALTALSRLVGQLAPLAAACVGLAFGIAEKRGPTDRVFRY